MQITKDITIAELINKKPVSVKYLMEKDIKCIACGEPVWGTLESESKKKGFSEEDINTFVNDLNELEN